MIDETGPTGEGLFERAEDGWGIKVVDYTEFPPVNPAPTLNLRRLALESAERHAIDADGRRLSGHGVLKLARMYLKFLEGE